ncbi:MAG: peptide deformylase [Oligoflexia bacterium]|nr:peptide deformylase [Oligoflexia bacterium]
MAVKKVIRMGHPTLRQVAKEFTKEEILSEETKQLIQDMHDTMMAESGIGIAAPQINVPKSVAIIGIENDNERYPDADPYELITVFNPKITVLDNEEQAFFEGCLSVPGLRGLVKRPRKVKIEYLDMEANKQEIIAEDFVATVFQHEIDHLIGKLYVDRVAPGDLYYNEEFDEFMVPDDEDEEA